MNALSSGRVKRKFVAFLSSIKVGLLNYVVPYGQVEKDEENLLEVLKDNWDFRSKWLSKI